MPPKNDLIKISSKEELIENIRTAEKYLSGDETQRDWMLQKIKSGRCFVCYKCGIEQRFIPSRFAGYVKNDMSKHDASINKDGDETNVAITTVFHKKNSKNSQLEKSLMSFCAQNGVKLANNTHRFWESDIIVKIRMKI